MIIGGSLATNDHGETFGGWLLAQKDPEGAIGASAGAAKADPKFPRRRRDEHDGAKPGENTIGIGRNEVSASRFIPVSEAPELGKQIEGFPVGVSPFPEDDSGNYFYINPREWISLFLGSRSG